MGVGMTTTLMSPSKMVMRAMTKTTRSCLMTGEMGVGTTTTLLSPSKMAIKAMTKTTRSCPTTGELGWV